LPDLPAVIRRGSIGAAAHCLATGEMIMANNPNVGPDPVEADPNHVREKTYEAPVVPKPYADQREALPETTAAEKVREELPEAIGAIKKRL
jgi:hypothetical protein